MSEFDDNPFADPFSEPSIKQATQPNFNNALSDYDPFGSTPSANINTSAQVEPAVMVPTTVASIQPPAYTTSAQQSINSAEFQRRQEELERKAEELARKEEQLRAVAAGTARENNWPPLPSVCPVGPCFYQDINVDIPNEFQRIVRYLYYLWMLNSMMLMLNMLGALALLFNLGEFSTFGLALFYAILFTPLSYICWFRPVYKAFRTDSSFNFMVFFFIFFFQMLVTIAQAIGVPNFGACGWIGVGRAFNNKAYGTGVFLIFVAIGSSVIAIAVAILLIWVHRIYRSTGASFSKAKQEFASGVMSNEHVQTMASSAASAAVRNQFAQSPTGSATSQPSGPRF